MGNLKSRHRTNPLVLTDSSETLPEDVEALVEFVSTSSGAKWLADILMGERLTICLEHTTVPHTIGSYRLAVPAVKRG